MHMLLLNIFFPTKHKTQVLFDTPQGGYRLAPANMPSVLGCIDHFKPTFLEALGKEWAFEDGADIIVTVDGMLFYVASGTVISAQDSKLKVESEGGWARLRKVVNEGAVLVRLEARLEAKFIIMPSPPPPAKTPQELNLTGGGQGTSTAET